MIENACLVAERACLSSLFAHGGDAYLDIETFVDDDCFTDDSNLRIWMAAKHVFDKDPDAKLNLAVIQVAAQEVGFGSFFDDKEELKYLRSLMQMPIELREARKFAAKISKLRIARLMAEQLGGAIENLRGVNGSEPMSAILGMAESVIFDFSKLMRGEAEGPVKVGDTVLSYLQDLADNPVQQIGIPTGFPEYDRAIGGGIRPGTISVIAARPKSGKSFIIANMGYYIASHGYPFLNLDSEMTLSDQMNRVTAMISGVETHHIENGQFGQDKNEYDRVMAAGKTLSETPYHYHSIAGTPIEEQLAYARRWIVKNGTKDASGKYPGTVIGYDYLKLMTSEGITNNMAEHQALGFLTSSLHNFAVKYGCGMIATVQVNRDGLTSESTANIAGSDRITWLCSNLSILKVKSEEERSEDGPDSGSRKLVVLAARHGAASDFGDYISVDFQPHIGRIRELGLRSQLKKKRQKDEGFVIEEDDEYEDEADSTCPFE